MSIRAGRPSPLRSVPSGNSRKKELKTSGLEGVCASTLGLLQCKGCNAYVEQGIENAARYLSSGLDCGDWQASYPVQQPAELQCPQHATQMVQLPVPLKHLTERAVAISTSQCLHLSVREVAPPPPPPPLPLCCTSHFQHDTWEQQLVCRISARR